VIYSLLRSTSAVALRWYYADVTIVGSERVPATGPLLVAVNHPNALVDVLIVGQAVPRRLMFTAKATLFSNRIAAWLLGVVGVVPLRRASDESGNGPVDPSRNAQVFDAIGEKLAEGNAILIFPEGKSHDEPAMAPLRTGAARMVLHARDAFHATGIRIVPVGLVFERKDRPRSRALAIVGEPIDVDAILSASTDGVRELTAVIDQRLHDLTLNYGSLDDAAQDARLAKTLAALLHLEASSVGDAGSLRARTEIARLLQQARPELLRADSPHQARARAFEASLEAFEQSLRHHRVALADLAISRKLGSGVLFVAREVLVLLVAGPVAAWGWINHLLPFTAALSAGGRIRHSAADPAMRTIVAGAAFILMMYMAQGAAVTLVAGPWWGMAYIASLPIAADINLRMRDRLHRVLRRARAYIRFRAEPARHQELVGQAMALRTEALALADLSGVGDSA
jgi:1-acyl-sn-glycerol-3-phosphate acyltransferase